MKNDEEKIQSAFFDWLRLNEKRYPCLKWFLHIPNGGHRNIVTAVRMKRQGVKRGVLDVFNPCGGIGDSKGLWIEFKTEKGKLSPEQEDWQFILTGEGYQVHVCRDWRNAAAKTIEYFKLPIKL